MNPRNPWSATLALVASGLVLLLAWLLVWTVGAPFNRTPGATAQFLEVVPAAGGITSLLRGAAATAAPWLDLAQPNPTALLLLTSGPALAGLGYAAGVTILAARRPRGGVGVVVGIALVSQLLLALVPWIFTTDPFSYVVYGRIGGILGANPYVDPPSRFMDQPWFGWVHPLWWNQPSVYGPLWERTGASLAVLVQGLHPIHQVLAFKAVSQVAFLLSLPCVWYLLGRFAPGPDRLASFALYAWNPLLLWEFSMGAHNDALMLLLTLLGLVAVARTSGPFVWVSGLALVGGGVLVKYMAALPGVLLAIASRNLLSSWRIWVAVMAGAAGIVAAVAIATGGGWLAQPGALQPLLDAGTARRPLNSVQDVAARGLAGWWPAPAGAPAEVWLESVRGALRAAARVLAGLYVAWEAWRLFAHPRPDPLRAAIAASARIFLVLVTLVLTWVLAWYFTWPLTLAVLLGVRSPLARLTAAYSVSVAVVFNAQDYWWVTMGGANMPDGLLVAALALPLLTLVLARRGTVKGEG